MSRWRTVLKEAFLQNRFTLYLTVAWVVGATMITRAFWPVFPYPFATFEGMGWRTLSAFLLVMGMGVWSSLRLGLDKQLTASGVQLVPGLRRAAVIVTIVSWLVMATAIAFETCIFGVPLPWVWSACLLFLAITTARQSALQKVGYVLWLLLLAPIYGYHFPLPEGPHAMRGAWATVPLTLAFGAAFIVKEFGKSADVYAALQGRLAQLTTPSLRERRSQIGFWDAVLMRPSNFQWWFDRVLRARSPEVRLLHGMGTAFHWSHAVMGVALQAGFTFLFMFVVSRMLVHETGEAKALESTLNVTAIGTCTFAVLLGEFRMCELYARRKEQALLLLLPGAPVGQEVNRWLIQSLVLQHAVAVVAGLWIVVAVAVALHHPLESTLKAMAAPLAVSLLFTPVLVRNYARMGQSRPFKYMLLALAVIAPLHVLVMPAKLLDPMVLMVIALVVSGVVVSWRYADLADAPPAFPVGRLSG